jgi:hypothetical protein
VEQQQADELVRAFTAPDGRHYSGLATACNFADDARIKTQDGDEAWDAYKGFEEWHFLNLPRGERHVKASACGHNCVLEGISRHFGELADHSLTKAERGRALLLLAHWVGDVHQPLHVSYADDLGGNRIKPIYGGYYYSFMAPKGHLHQVWDSRIIDRAIGNQRWWKYADSLAASIQPASASQWLAVPQLAWAEESYAITTSEPVEYCAWVTTSTGERCRNDGHTRKLTGDYQHLFAPYVELRLQQGGVRLADLIRQALQ